MQSPIGNNIMVNAGNEIGGNVLPKLRRAVCVNIRVNICENIYDIQLNMWHNVDDRICDGVGNSIYTNFGTQRTAPYQTKTYIKNQIEAQCKAQ